MKKTIRIGSRGSKLALVQAETYKKMLEERYPEQSFEIVKITTKGDQNQKDEARKIGQGIFTREIEKALLNGEIDLAVHSLKDLPSKIEDGLALVAPPRRENPRDVLLVKEDVKDKNAYAFLSEKKIIGTGSPRRAVQIKEIGEKTIVRPIRGNVDTRIQKLVSGEYDGIVLAQAGISRLGLDLKELGVKIIPLPEDFIPAPGQGILGIEVRKGDDEILSLLSPLSDLDTARAMRVERAVLEELGGACDLPIGAYFRLEDDQIAVMSGLFGDEEGNVVAGEFAGPPSQSAKIAKTLSDTLKERLSQEQCK